MSATVVNLAIMAGLVQVGKKIPFEEQPELVTYARIVYASAQLACLALFYVCTLKIKARNDVTVLKYVKPKSPMSQEPGELVTTTHREYDLGELQKSVRDVFTGCILVAVLHLYLGYTQPLVLQSVIPLKNALESKEVQIWLWGKPARGELKRPFAASTRLFGTAAGGQQSSTNKAAIKQAEAAPKTSG